MEILTLPLGNPRSLKHCIIIFSVFPDANVRETLEQDEKMSLFRATKSTFLSICIGTIVSLCMSVSVSVLSILWQSCLSARSPVFMSFCQFTLVPSLTFGQGSCHSGWPWSIVSSSWNQTQVYSHHVELIVVSTWVKSLNNVYTGMDN